MQGKRPHSDFNRERSPEISNEDMKAIIVDGDTKMLNDKADKLGKYYNQGGERQKLSSSQIRSVLDYLQRMSEYNLRAVQLLRPKLAYAAGRHKGKVLELQKVTEKAIALIDDPSSFDNFKNFFEAIVAYHRYHGGK